MLGCGHLEGLCGSRHGGRKGTLDGFGEEKQYEGPEVAERRLSL
jgi:hypothetical protein